MSITIEQIQKLRSETSAPIMECKKALEESQGDIEKAKEILIKRGQKIAAKKADREVLEGWIGSYVHFNGKVAALVEVNCETDFVASNEEFKRLAYELALQVATMGPEYISIEDVPEEVKEKEIKLEREKLKEVGKPEEVIQKVLEGKLQKFYESVCLLEQPYVKNEKLKIKDLINQAITKLGENIKVRRFVRLEIGGK